MKKILYFLAFFTLLLSSTVCAVSPSSSIVEKNELTNLLQGEGVTITNMHITGNAQQFGKFTGADDITGFKNIKDGIILSTGIAKDMFVPASTFLSKNYAAYSHGNIFDEAYIEFDAISDSNFISFQYIFASEEFDQAPQFNDLMTIEVNGKNIALIPDSDEIVCINSLRNTEYHYDNYVGKDIGYLGYTPLLSCQADITPGQINHFKISVKDLGDPIYDSALFIKAHSLSNKKAPDPEVNPNPPTRDRSIPVNFTKQISALKLTLADGSILYDIKLQGNSSPNSLPGILLSDKSLFAAVDEELLHGATLEVEYKFTLQSFSELPCLGYSIKDTLDNKFIYEDNHILLTESIPNSYHGWKVSDDGKSINLSKLDNLTNGQTVEKKVVLTTTLSVSSLNDYIYKNSAKATFKFARGSVSKSADAIEVRLLPPFGKNSYINFYIMGIVINLTILTFVVLEKHHLKERTKEA